MSTTPPTDTSSLLRRLEGAEAFELTLLERCTLSPSLVSLALGGVPAGLEIAPGQDLMLAVPVEGGDGSFRRRYTVRRRQREQGQVELWIDVASEGPGATWASSAPIGSKIEGIGPRGKVVLDEHADWHLFVGDVSFMAAAYAMAEAIEAPGQALFIFEIDHADDAVTPSLGEEIAVTLGFIERGERTFDDPSGLLAGLAALELPEDEGHVYVGGELTVVAALRTALLERGVSRDALDAKSYWRLGVANLAHGEPLKSDG